MKLTEIRLDEYFPLFDTALETLLATGRYDVSSLEKSLMAEMNCNQKEMRPFLKGLAKNETYEPVAIYFMEHFKSSGMPQEYQRPISKAYGIKNYFSVDHDVAKKRYWDKILRPTTSGE